METEEAALSQMLETCLQALEAARAQEQLPAHILTAMEETCADLRVRLGESRAESP